MVDYRKKACIDAGKNTCKKIGPTTTRQNKASFSNSRSIFCENNDELSSKHNPEKDCMTMSKGIKRQNWGSLVEFSRPFFRLFPVPNVKSSPVFVMVTFFSRGIPSHLFSEKFSTTYFLLSKNSILLLSLQFRKEGLKVSSVYLFESAP